jgi:uncharacterized protein (TIGR03382 family)
LSRIIDLLFEYRKFVVAGGAAFFLMVLAAIVFVVLGRRRRARELLAPLPLIPFSTARGVAGPRRPDGFGRAAGGPIDFGNAPTPAWSPDAPDRESVDRARFASPTSTSPTPTSPSTRSPANPSVPDFSRNPLSETARPTDLVDGAPVDGASVRYWRPADGTLQFLPGRLEVIAGRDAGQEIRFVRTPGPDGTLVTFGRAEGAPYRHVQLREPTVSRTHARMTLDGRIGHSSAEGRAGSNGGGASARWRLENLSATNPVVVNGRPLAADESVSASVVLGEGDRIEMGEVVFRFHEK